MGRKPAELKTPTDSIELCALLGNPGRRYAKTRHNAAWLLADIVWGPGLTWRDKFHGAVGEIEACTLLRPMTMMNESGRAVRAAVDFFKLDSSRVVVVYDDVETPLGTLQLAYSTGHRGHNGCRSVLQHLGNQPLWQLRIGIGRPAAVVPVAQWVLSPFTEYEYAVVESSCRSASVAVSQVLKQPKQGSLT